MSTALIPTQPPARQEFAALFNRLCVAVREPADESGITLATYWEALKDVPVQALEAAATALMREPGRRWLPSVGEWRAAALAASEQTLRAAIRPVRDDWREECEACHDTGWLYDRHCSGQGECGMGSCLRMSRRGGGYGPHPYATPCACRPMNRTYQRTVQAGMSGRASKDAK